MIKKNIWYISTHMSFKITDLEHNHGLMKIIKEQGKSLLDLKLLIANETGILSNLQTSYLLEYISAGCPKLKSLTLESLRGWKDPKDESDLKASFMEFGMSMVPNPDPKEVADAFERADFSGIWDIRLNREDLEEFYKGCKELEDLKLSKILFEDIFEEDDIQKIFPDCNVEINECHYETPHESDSDWITTDDDSDNV